MDLTDARQACGEWNEDLNQCDNEFPADCPFCDVCKKDAEENED